MGKLLPLIFLIVGLGGGIGAGIVLSPAPEEEAMDDAGDPEEMKAAMEKDMVKEAPLETEFHKLANQFVVPLIKEGRVVSQVVLSMSLEIMIGVGDTVFAMEPKLRGSFLQVLFDHANMGGFKGVFTDSNTMDLLRRALTEAAQDVIGDGVVDVVITNIARQDT